MRGTETAANEGISDYVRAQSEYYYVDKNVVWLKIFFRSEAVGHHSSLQDQEGLVNLKYGYDPCFWNFSKRYCLFILRIKQFGIVGKKYRSHQGKYPVIFLTFKDAKFDS